jgi:hypothetical protein
MKTQFTLWQKVANTPPIALLVLFVWLLVPSNAWGDPIAIGTGTVTLDYTKTSDPAAPATNTCVIENETCIAFGNTSTWASWVYSSGVSWNVTIVPGVYDIEATYGTGSWGTKPLFDLYEGEKKVTEIFHAPGGETSGNFNTKAGFSGSNTVDLSTLDGNTTYTLKVTDGWPGAFGTCIGHISFTPKVGVVMAAFGQSADGGPTTLPNNGSNTINGITVTTNMELDLCNGRTYDYLFGNEGTDYVDISVGSDQIMTALALSILYDGSCTGGLYIKFSSSATFDEDALVGTSILLSGLVFDNFYTYPPSTSSVSLPSGTIKSARIYRNGSCQYGTRLYRIKVEAEADECIKKTASFVKEGTEIGSAPGEIEVCEDASITIPGKGSLSKTGNVFAGWNDGSNTYQEGDSYEMNGSNHTFTAVWTPFTVPAVTNLAVGDAVDKEVPLSWSIPGICDLSNPVIPIADFHDGTPVTPYPVDDNIVTVEGSMGGGKQFGVAFNIGDVTGITSVSFKAKDKSLSSGVNLWIAAINTESRKAYWEFDGDLHNCHPGSDKWYAYSFSPNISYWNNNWGGSPDYNTDIHIQQIGIFANAPGSSSLSGQGFYVNEVRYHISGKEDIDHVIVVRKEGSAPANATDGTVYNVGTKSHFLDDDDTKEFGHKYYYSVYAVHADGTVSEATTTSHTIVATPTCNITFNVGDGAIGDAPSAIEDKPENSVVTMPSIGTVYKPFYAFTGWKKNNAGDLISAGASYTVTAADVEAATISFTAQWVEDVTTQRIPSVTTLDDTNQSTNVGTDKIYNGVDFDGDKNEDPALALKNSYVEWNVFITPGYYDVSMLSAVERYGMGYKLSLIDPLTGSDVKVLFTKRLSRDGDQTVFIDNAADMFDLTDLVEGKRYILKMEDTWKDCYLRLHHINFAACAPKEIPDETHFNKDNAFSAVTTATDMDIDGEAGNDELINLDRKYVEWDVKVTPGVYNVSLVYGAPQYNIKVSVALIDPENPASVIYLSKEGNNTYYYKSGSQNTPHHYTSTTRCDLTEIDGNKTYRLRISDEYDGSNYLRVKDLTFASVAPIAISNVTDTRLDATNTILPPTMATDLDIDDDSNVDNLMNLYNTNAEWQVTLNKGLYNVQLVYGAPGYSIKVAVRLIDPAGEEPDKVLSIEDNKDYYYKSNPATTEEAKATTPHHYTSATKCALLDVTEDKIYKVRVADVYPKCNLRVSHVLFTPIAPVEIHEEATLNASNVMVAPSIVDSRIDISNQQEAVWYATIDPHKFDITLTYFAEEGGTKVRFAIIPVGGDTIFVHQENKHDASNTTYTIPALDQDLTNISSGVYKIIVKDNYKSNDSKPQIISLTFSRAITTHTRSGLNVGDYGTVCLPYAIEAANINGAEIYKLIEWPAGSCAVTLEQVENMEAGHPYIYQATANTATWRYNAEGDPTDATSENGLIGSYTKELISPNANNYIIYNNKLYYVDSEAYVGANRAYINRIEAENAPTPGPANGRKRIQMAVNGAQVLTGIDQLNDQMTNTKYMENGILYILRDGKLYNAQGQLVK